jgi:hypothetical protein
MTRDESTEGWLPAAGGGLANVSIRKRPRMQSDVVGFEGFEYIIYGQRISDQTVKLTVIFSIRYYKFALILGHLKLRHQS